MTSTYQSIPLRIMNWGDTNEQVLTGDCYCYVIYRHVESGVSRLPQYRTGDLRLTQYRREHNNVVETTRNSFMLYISVSHTPIFPYNNDGSVNEFMVEAVVDLICDLIRRYQTRSPAT